MSNKVRRHLDIIGVNVEDTCRGPHDEDDEEGRGPRTLSRGITRRARRAHHWPETPFQTSLPLAILKITMEPGGKGRAETWVRGEHIE